MRNLFYKKIESSLGLLSQMSRNFSKTSEQDTIKQTKSYLKKDQLFIN
jgi:hypothetical protein